ncbi:MULTISPECIES: META domain-containing protein [unclassified Methylobacterium]|jgi:heat shock protein HslJ|uniref:META domain-containing protein n=1 Tax=unclassified Methylobacterium TaxID=2615210 RepID=UPI0006F1F9E7|nr:MULTISPECIES: META domain-containing protein [unclassified Methylobacterium]KQO68087.1 heat-shock protein [Methylobacterium sp. Leaf89]KQO69976.1 heat-shock protein [Methylobacterium sp. Leaf88]KQP76926.1 heat-shock protein [Methylobacterium sp. Leaf111]KQT76419.1 heat-shock protein [Methylobacterium sp. Leaf465]KQU27419.1 heat-shock protein [Methylobacterium sp. Leaf94]
MRAIRIAMVAGAIAAGAMTGAMTTAATAQMGNNVTGFGREGREKPEKKQYVPAAKPQEKIFPLDATWTAVSLNGKPFGGNDRPSFTIDKQYRARGYGGCNTFAATAFPLKEQHLAVGPLALTKKPCDKGLGASEQDFFIALRTAGQWDLVGSQLVIKSQKGELRFDRAL